MFTLKSIIGSSIFFFKKRLHIGFGGEGEDLDQGYRNHPRAAISYSGGGGGQHSK